MTNKAEDLTSLTKAKLVELADSAGVPDAQFMSKSQLVEALHGLEKPAEPAKGDPTLKEQIEAPKERASAEVGSMGDAPLSFSERLSRLREANPRFNKVSVHTEAQLEQLELEAKIIKRAELAFKPSNMPRWENIDRARVMASFSLFMRYVPIPKIADETGLEKAFLEELIFETNGWKEQRQIAYKEATSTIRMLSIAKLKETISTGLELVNMSFKALKQECDSNNQAPSLIEAERISGILLKLYKAQLIDTAKDDDEQKKIGETLPPDAIMSAFAQDPYIRTALKNLMEAPPMDLRNGDGAEREDS